jgi:hypothetical protein
MNGWTKGDEVCGLEEEFAKDAVLSLIILKLCGACLTKEALEDFGDF